MNVPALTTLEFLGPLNRALAVRSLADDLKIAKALRWQSRKLSSVERTCLRTAHRTRLGAVHQCALENPATARAAEFFMSDLYPLEAPAWRDSQALAALPTLSRFLPDNALAALACAARLDRLGEELDARCLERTEHLGWQNSWPSDKALYRIQLLADGVGPRLLQVECMRHAGAMLSEFAKSSLARGALSAMRFPARLSGLSELQNFLERGLYSFETLADPMGFCEGLFERETADLNAPAH